MTKPTITPLPDPSGFSPDPLTDILRSGARRLIEQAVEAELTALLAAYADDKSEDGRSRVVRHGYLPEREVMTGIGPVPVKVPRVRDRAAGAEKVRFTSSILPPYLRKAKSVEELLPWLYLKGISSGDFQEALAALLGPNAAGLSSTTISRLKAAWWDEYDRWQRRDLGARRIVYIWADGVYFQPRMAEEKQCVLVVIGADEWGRKEVLGLTDGYDRWQRRDLSARRYVYIWADGVYLQARMEAQAECMLVILGATPEGKKELVGFQVGVRESAQSWRELLVDIKSRGLKVPPEIAVGDGGMGFWKALDEIFPGTRHQRCWVHKSANVLNKFPKSMHPAVKADLREIWQAETRAAAEAALDTFAEKYRAKYEKAVTCLTKDQEALLAFYAFPAEHWDHLRTGNPIESIFATVRHRTIRTKGALSQKTAKLMVFKLVQAAAKTWRRLKGANQLPRVIEGVTFTDGVAARDTENRAA